MLNSQASPFVRRLYCVVIVMLGAAGCTTLKTADTAPIEEQVQIQYGKIEVELDLNEVIALNPYVTGDSPAVDAFSAARADLMEAAEGLVDYSIAIIEILETRSKEEAVAELAPLVGQLRADISALPTIAPFLEGVDLSDAIQAAADEKNSTKALRAMAPANSQISNALHRAIEEVERLYDLAYEETYTKIDKEVAPFMTYIDLLIVRRNSQLEKLTLVEYARLGDESAWNKLLEDATIADAVGNKPMSLASIKQAEALLSEEVIAMTELYHAIEPTWDAYKETITELNSVDSATRKNLRAADGVIRDWENAQQRLAKGQPSAFVAVTRQLGVGAWRRFTGL